MVEIQDCKHLGRSYNTVKNEIERGTVLLYNGNVKRYKADVGKVTHLHNRQNSRRKYRFLESAGFLRSVVKHFRNDGWSLDACVGNALLAGEFTRSEIVCTITLYNQ